MARVFRKRQLSFVVTVVRDRDGHKHYVTRCRKCGEVVPAVDGMKGHANQHFKHDDRLDQRKRWEGEDVERS